MKKIILTIFFGTAVILFFPTLVQASVCNDNVNLSFVARDPQGDYIASAYVEVYKQDFDANGNPKPTTRLDSATTSQNLGIANLNFRDKTVLRAKYAIKVELVNNDDAAFWFYDNTFNCGETVSVEKTLSAILFTLRDPDGNLLRNTNFSVYSQLYDSSGRVTKEKKERLMKLNTGYSGQAKIYLPKGSVRGIGRDISDHYAIELSYLKVQYNFYNIEVRDGSLTEANYYLSALKIRLQNSNGNPFPPDTKVEVFKQKIDSDNQNERGVKVGEFSIGDNGYGDFLISPGVYVLGVKGENNQYQYFWNIEAESGRTTEHTVTASQSWTQSEGSCQNDSQFTLNVHDFSGRTVPNLKFELYEQGMDSNGLPVANSKVKTGTLNSYGQGIITFEPDPRIGYALKIWDKKADLGEYWFFDAVKFVCDYNRSVNKTIPALNIVLRDQDGNLKRNYDFSLYAQRYDADNNPTRADKDLIAKLKTDSGGQALVYVSPYNAYRPNQTGVYTILSKDSSGNYVTLYDINIKADQDYNFEQSFSGLSGKLSDAFDRTQTDKDIRLYEQISGANGKTLGKMLTKERTDKSGSFRFDYPVGTYALAVTDQFKQENVFWNISANGQGKNYNLVTNLTRLGFSAAQIGSISGDIYFKLYNLVSENGSTFYRDREITSLKLESGNAVTVSLAAGPYLAVYISGSGGEFGQAFYAQNGQLQTVELGISRNFIITPGQAFSLTIPNYVPRITTNATSAATPASNTVTNSPASANSRSMAGRLKGRILIQVQDKGQAWYVSPDNQKRYYLGRPADAFNVMRTLGLGISNADFAAMENNPPSRLYGKILLKVEDKGKAYYVDPVNKKLHYLGRPADAFNVMRTLGLGITDGDLSQISAN